MELASGKVRYEFSGPGAFHWYATFLPDGSAFLASRLFGRAVNAWPTKPAREDRAPPEPLRAIEGFERTPTNADVSPTGTVAFAIAGGDVVLKTASGEAPRLASPEGEGEGASAVTFTPSGSHVVALRAGRVHAWRLPDGREQESKPAAPPPPR